MHEMTFENELRAVKAELQEWKTRHAEPAPSAGLLGFWKGGGKVDEKKGEEKPTKVSTPTIAHTTATDTSNKQPPVDGKQPISTPSPPQTGHPLNAS
jgi:hypothetical protein